MIKTGSDRSNARYSKLTRRPKSSNMFEKVYEKKLQESITFYSTSSDSITAPAELSSDSYMYKIILDDMGRYIAAPKDSDIRD